MVAGKPRCGKRRRTAFTLRRYHPRHAETTMPRLNRIYTRTGDEGLTGLGGGQRVPKDSQRVETYGTVDELNSQIGVAIALGLCDRLMRRAPGDPEPAVRPGLGPGDAGHQPGTPPGADGPAAPCRGARAAHRRSQRGRRPAGQLPAPGRLRRRRRSCTWREPSAGGPSGPRPRLPARSPSDRRCSPTSIACPTRCS